MKFAEAHGHFATAAKLLEEEIGEKGPSQAQETQIIKVVEGEGGGRKGKEEGEGKRNRGEGGRVKRREREGKGGKWKVEANDLNMIEKGR